MSHEIKLIDAMRGLGELTAGSVDLIVTDPPYDTLEKWRERGTTTRLKKSKQSSNEWFPTVPPSYFPDFFAECYRVLHTGTDMYVMCDEETGDNLKPMVREAGFTLRKSLIWWKVGKHVEIPCKHCGKVMAHTNKPGVPGMGYPYRSCAEYILLARKGKRPMPEDKGVRNVLPIPWIKRKKAYPTEKPVELCETLIKQSSSKGEFVLDPFAGSGSCGEAAYNLGREFLGFDVEQPALDSFEHRKREWDNAGVPTSVINGGLEPIDTGVFKHFGRKAP